MSDNAKNNAKNNIDKSITEQQREKEEQNKLFSLSFFQGAAYFFGVLGVILLLCFIMMWPNMNDYFLEGLIEFIIVSIFAFGFIALGIRLGKAKKRQIEKYNMYKKYRSIINQEMGRVSIYGIASLYTQDYEQTVKDLKYLIEEQFFRGAYIDYENGMLVLDSNDPDSEEMLNEFIKMLDDYDDDGLSNYWYVAGVDDAREIMNKFNNDDWEKLMCIFPKKSTLWQERLINCIPAKDEEHRLKVLNETSKTDDLRLFRNTVPALCRYDYYQIERVGEIVKKINSLDYSKDAAYTKIFNDFLEKFKLGQFSFDSDDYILRILVSYDESCKIATFGDERHENLMGFYLDNDYVLNEIILYKMQEMFLGKPEIKYSEGGVLKTSANTYYIDYNDFGEPLIISNFETYLDNDTLIFKFLDKDTESEYNEGRITYGYDDDLYPTFLRVNDITEEEYKQIIESVKKHHIPIVGSDGVNKFLEKNGKER